MASNLKHDCTQEGMVAMLSKRHTDYTTRLIYADWLEEQGDGKEAERQRVIAEGDRDWIARWEPQVGRCVMPDEWRYAMPLETCDWEEAPFRLHAQGVDLHLAVRVEVTGRIPSRKPFGMAVRCRIVFVGDGEDDVVTHGWLEVPSV